MMKRIFSLLGVALTCIATNLSTQSAAAEEESGAPEHRPFTLSLEAGTTGFGGSFNWRFTDHFGARAGFNYFTLSDDGNEIEGIYYDTDLRLMSEPLAVDIYPWKKSTFRVTVGVLFNQNRIEGVVPQDPIFGNTFIDIGGVAFDSASIGDLNMRIDQMPVSPYLSVGMSFFLDDARHWSLSGELGVAYTGSPDVALGTSTGLVPQAQLDIEAQELEDWAERYQFYPILKFSVNYSF
jgi:hypothetical protein